MSRLSHRIRLTIATASALAFVALSGLQPARAQNKPACGIDYLPLAVGNTWTYESIESPIPLSEEEQAGLKKWAMQDPRPVAKVEIEVLSVEDSGDETVITLSEQVGDVSRETTLRCTRRGGLVVDPQSFFFAAEPGGALNMTLSDVERDGDGLPGFRGFRRGDQATLKLTAKLQRSATEGSGAELTSGSIEIERTLSVGISEDVSSPTGKHRNAQRVQFTLEGRVTVEPEAEKYLPLRMNGISWWKDGVGLVQARNRIGHWYTLAATNTK